MCSSDLIKSQEGVVEFLKTHLKERLGGEHPKLNKAESGPTVILVAGVNGCGKTTTIAKLANQWRRQGKSVMLAAGDTFRVAAIEQLQIWGARAGCPGGGREGAGPAARG